MNEHNHSDISNIQENILLLIDNYIEDNIKLYKYPNFITDLYISIFNILKELYNNEIISHSFLQDVLNISIDYYFETIGIPRSIDNITHPPILNKEKTKARLQILKMRSQSEQKSDKWYEQRHNMCHEVQYQHQH